MKILLHDSMFKQNEPVTFEISSQGTAHMVNFVLVDPSGAILEQQSLIPEHELIQFDYDPAKHFGSRIKFSLDFSEHHGGYYDVTLASGSERKKIGHFQVFQPIDKHKVFAVFGLEGDDDVDAPED
jgi:hypothetical protein